MIIESNATHIPLKDESVHCVITSPPYWGLRVYDIPKTIWDVVEGCEHEWKESIMPAANGIIQGEGMSGETLSGRSATRKPQKSNFCVKCDAWRGQLGLEPTIDLYVKHIVQVFREVRRVLRNDGVLWLNLGDSYAGSWGDSGHRPWRDGVPGTQREKKPGTVTIKRHGHPLEAPPMSKKLPGLKPKDLCEIPSEVVRALRDDGWWLRSRIPWIKRNCMPESVDDRPTVAIEYIFLLTKNKDYFYDAESIKITASEDTHARYARGRRRAADYPGGQTICETYDHMVNVPPNYKGSVPGRKDGPGQDRRSKKDRLPGVNPKAICSGKETGRELGGLKTASRFGHGPGWRVKQNESFSAAVKDIVGSRNRRNSDWFFESWQGLLSDSEGDPIACVVNPQPYKGAHYSTFPEKLIEPMIKAGCPQFVCKKCGKARERIIERIDIEGDPPVVTEDRKALHGPTYSRHRSRVPGGQSLVGGKSNEIGLTDCGCNAEFEGGAVLDPFHGSGTVGAVAERLNRRWVGLDLGYHDLQKRRLVGIQKEMPLMG